MRNSFQYVDLFDNGWKSLLSCASRTAVKERASAGGVKGPEKGLSAQGFSASCCQGDDHRLIR